MFSNHSLIIKNYKIITRYILIHINKVYIIFISEFLYSLFIVRPDKPFPVIDQCSEKTRICFLPIENALTITCAVQKARPAVDIFWSRRIAEGEIDIVSQEKGVVNGNITFSSYAVMISQPLNPGQLLLLVCKGSTLPKLLKSEESVLLVQQSYRFRPEYSSSERRLVEKGSNTVIHCTQGELFYLVWTKFHENTVEQVAWAIFLKDNISNSMSETVEVGFNGSLKLIDINPNQDGLYSCNYNDGDSDMTNFYHVLVYGKSISKYVFFFLPSFELV